MKFIVSLGAIALDHAWWDVAVYHKRCKGVPDPIERLPDPKIKSRFWGTVQRPSSNKTQDPAPSKSLLGPTALLPRRNKLDLALLLVWLAVTPDILPLVLLLLKPHPSLGGLGGLGPDLLAAAAAQVLAGPGELGADLATVDEAHDAAAGGVLLRLGQVDLVGVVGAECRVCGGAEADDVLIGAGALCRARGMLADGSGFSRLWEVLGDDLQRSTTPARTGSACGRSRPTWSRPGRTLDRCWLPR